MQQKNQEQEKGKTEEYQKNVFDRIADLFEKMDRGIVEFCFVKLPRKIMDMLFRNWKAFFHFLYSIWRIVFWGFLWIILLFAAWISFDMKKLQEIINVLIHIVIHLLLLLENIWDFLYLYRGPVWFILALIGSIYGLLYISLKKLAKKKNRAFHGVFGFLRRKKTQTKISEEKNMEADAHHDNR